MGDTDELCTTHEYLCKTVKIWGHYGILIPLKHVYHNKKVDLKWLQFYTCMYLYCLNTWHTLQRDKNE